MLITVIQMIHHMKPGLVHLLKLLQHLPVLPVNTISKFKTEKKLQGCLRICTIFFYEYNENNKIEKEDDEKIK